MSKQVQQEGNKFGMIETIRGLAAKSIFFFHFTIRSIHFVGVTTALLICYIEFRSRIKDFLGKVSFSFYLLHAPISRRVIN